MDRMDKICKWINNLLELIKSDTNHAHDRTDAVADITYNKEKKLDKIITDVQIGLHNLEEKVRGKFQELDTLLEWAKRQSEIIQGRRIDRLEKRKK
jgi:flagellar capping protein FliD